MALFNALVSDDLKELVTELRLSRIALQSIAESLVRATGLPEPLTPDEPLGADAIGSYGETVDDLEGESANQIRERLRSSGITDIEAERMILTMFEEDAGLSGE